jgi:sec-independent protein translocase protein TatC
MVLSAVLSPPDVPSMLILFSVVYSLYEVSILLVKRIEMKRRADLAAEGILDENEE